MSARLARQARAALEEDQGGADRAQLLEQGRGAPAVLGGGKPANRKRSVGRPATARAASSAEAPGIGKTGEPGARRPRAPAGSRGRRPAACRRRRPGPRAGRRPGRASDLGPRALAGVVVVALQLLLQAVGGQQLAGDAGVLGQHQVGGGQHVERAQGDVAQVPDRRRHQIEAGRQRGGGGRGACGSRVMGEASIRAGRWQALSVSRAAGHPVEHQAAGGRGAQALRRRRRPGPASTRAATRGAPGVEAERGQLGQRHALDGAQAQQQPLLGGRDGRRAARASSQPRPVSRTRGDVVGDRACAATVAVRPPSSVRRPWAPGPTPT